MSEEINLSERFAAERARLGAVAFRMLGSKVEADDAVQEAWLRLSRADAGKIENLRGWLTTVVAHVCLDLLRSRKTRAEVAFDAASADELDARGDVPHAEREAQLADAVGPALMVVLETLAPAERVAFVLHDLFGVPFDDVARIVGRSSEATRQLASRARRRIRGADPERDAESASERELVDAFLAASRGGSFEALVAVLDPAVVLRVDPAAVRAAAAAAARGAPTLAEEVRGAEAVARAFAGRAQAAKPALIDGAPGAVWVHGGQPRAAFLFKVAADRDKIVEIQIVSTPERVAALDVVVLEP